MTWCQIFKLFQFVHCFWTENRQDHLFSDSLVNLKHLLFFICLSIHFWNMAPWHRTARSKIVWSTSFGDRKLKERSATTGKTGTDRLMGNFNEKLLWNTGCHWIFLQFSKPGGICSGVETYYAWRGSVGGRAEPLRQPAGPSTKVAALHLISDRRLTWFCSSSALRKAANILYQQEEDWLFRGVSAKLRWWSSYLFVSSTSPEAQNIHKETQADRIGGYLKRIQQLQESENQLDERNKTCLAPGLMLVLGWHNHFWAE